MDGKTLRNLRIAQELTQETFAALLGVDRSFVAQIETEVRVLPKNLVQRAEHLLAIGSPSSRDETLLYVPAVLRANGGFTFPKELIVFRTRELADGAATLLRRIGYDRTTIVPVWENGIAQLADFAGGSLGHDVKPVDETLANELARGFRTTKRLDPPSPSARLISRAAD